MQFMQCVPSSKDVAIKKRYDKKRQLYITNSQNLDYMIRRENVKLYSFP